MILRTGWEVLCIAVISTLAFTAANCEGQIRRNNTAAVDVSYVLLKRNLDPNKFVVKQQSGASDFITFRNLTEVQDLLSSAGVKSTLLKNVSLIDLLKSLDKSDMAIAEMAPPTIQSLPGCLLFDEYEGAYVKILAGVPYKHVKITTGRLITVLTTMGSGDILLISNRQNIGKMETSKGIAKAHPTLDVVRDDESKFGPIVYTTGNSLKVPNMVLLGNIPRNGQLVTSILDLTNVSSTPIDISKFTGVCSCFKNAKGPSQIKAHSTASYELSFDVSRPRTSDTFDSQIGFQTSDLKLPRVAIDIHGQYDDYDYEFADPSVLDLGVVSKSKSGVITVPIKLYKSALAYNPSDKIVKVLGLKEYMKSHLNGETALHDYSNFICFASYQIDWDPKLVALGYITGQVTFRSSDKTYTNIPLRWSASVVP